MWRFQSNLWHNRKQSGHIGSNLSHKIFFTEEKELSSLRSQLVGVMV
jgi:hypothetical protein